MWSVVFLASPPAGEMASRLPGKDYVSCFLPCTPNPTTGFFFYIRRSEVIELDVTPDRWFFDGHFKNDPCMPGTLMLEACLEAMRTGAIVGIQDMGAAGLACCTAEMPGRAGTGMDVELARVPTRETGMTPYQILLSESQERMLLVIARGREDEVRRVFAKWELDAVQIGEVTAGADLVVRHRGDEVARVPVEALAEAPRYEKPHAAPAWLEELRAFDPLTLPEPADHGEALTALMGSPTIASKEWAYRQYDQQVGINTLVLPGSDATVLRVKGTRRAVAMATDGNGRQVFLDPRRGAAMAVCEAARNVSCAGALPAGLTDCLNFGSPERPEILWQFAEAVDGIADACRALQVPVVGGNVSFYNETSGQAVLPTPVVGVVGILDGRKPHLGRGDVVDLSRWPAASGEPGEELACIVNPRGHERAPCPPGIDNELHDAVGCVPLHQAGHGMGVRAAPEQCLVPADGRSRSDTASAANTLVISIRATPRFTPAD